MNKLRNLTLTIFIGVITGIAASAQETNCAPGPCGVTVSVYRDGKAWIQEIKGSISPGKGLRLQSALGSVQVNGSPTQRNVTYTIKKRVFRSDETAAKRDMAIFKVNVQRRDWEAVTIDADWEGGHSGKLNAEFYVTVPRDSVWVKVATLGGNVDVKNINGTAYADTAGGNISLDEITGKVRANTMGGSINVGNVGDSAKLETAGGSINIGSVAGMIEATTSGGSVQVGSGKQNVRIETAGGSISVKDCSGQLNASTAGGNIDVGQVGGSAWLNSDGGGIRMLGAKGEVKAVTASGGIRLSKLTRGVRAETMAGPIEAEFIASRGEFTDSHLETNVGDIIVYLPSDLPVTVKAGIEFANGHKIFSDFPGLNVTSEGGQYGPKTIYADGKLNGGGPVLKVHTTNGNIEIRRTRR